MAAVYHRVFRFRIDSSVLGFSENILHYYVLDIEIVYVKNKKQKRERERRKKKMTEIQIDREKSRIVETKREP